MEFEHILKVRKWLENQDYKIVDVDHFIRAITDRGMFSKYNEAGSKLWRQDLCRLLDEGTIEEVEE